MKVSFFGKCAIFLFIMVLTACAGDAAEPPPQEASLQAEPPAESNPVAAATATPGATATIPPTATAAATAPLAPTATNTLVAIASATPPPEASATPEPAPVVRLNQEVTSRLNVRGGPGTNYPVISQMEPGTEAVVTGRNEAGDWWQIEVDNPNGEAPLLGWVYAQLVTLVGDAAAINVAAAPPPPAPAPTPVAAQPAPQEDSQDSAPDSAEALADQLRCGKDFCVTYQALVPMLENGGCIGNHSIYVTVLQGPPPGVPMDGVVIGDTFNNVEVGSGSKGPGHAEITLWNNSMTLVAKRHIDGTPYSSEESFNFTSHDELIPAEVLAAGGYCEGDIQKCREAQQSNRVCRGHYSWRVTFHKFD